MLSGQPEYGCRANPDKVQLTFELRHDQRVYEARREPIAWCGLLLHIDTLGAMIFIGNLMLL
jgi:hypothetical protein